MLFTQMTIHWQSFMYVYNGVSQKGAELSTLFSKKKLSKKHEKVQNIHSYIESLGILDWC